MVSKLARVKEIVLEILSDGKEHTSVELLNCINNKGIEISKESSTLRTAIYQMRNNGVDIYILAAISIPPSQSGNLAVLKLVAPI